MKNSFKDTPPLDKKYLSQAGVSEKWKNLTSTSQKSVSMSRNKVSLKKFAAPEF